MAWIKITAREYHQFYRRFEYCSAAPKDVSSGQWKITWQKFEILDEHGSVVAVEWHYQSKPKIRYDFKHPRSYFRFDQNVIEQPDQIRKVIPTLEPDIVLTAPDRTLQDRYNPKARFFEVLRQLELNTQKPPFGDPSPSP